MNRIFRNITFLTLIPSMLLTCTPQADAQDGSRLRQWVENRMAEKEAQEKAEASIPDIPPVTARFKGREYEIFVPPKMPAKGKRAMVVVLHGGTGNASHIHEVLGMDAAARQHGFIVLYLNGTQAGERLPEKMKAWNAGGECCGLPGRNNIDDIGYITEAAKAVAKTNGVNPDKIFIVGHSNGAMMAQRLMCETRAFNAAVPISGPLNIDVPACTRVRGHKILALHGKDDKNVPFEGGTGTRGVTSIAYKSQIYSKDIFEKSGASYELQILEGAEHGLQGIRDLILQQEKQTLADKITRFFGLDTFKTGL